MPLFGKSSSSNKDDKKDEKKSSSRRSSNGEAASEEKKKKSSSKDKDRKKKSSSSSDDDRKKSSSKDKDKKKKSSSSSSDDRKKSSKRSSGSKSSSTGSTSNGSSSSLLKSASSAASSSSGAASSASVNKQGPGSVSVGANTATFRVQVPPNVKPGEEFQVYAGQKIVKVRCPRNVKPGQSLQISVPVDPMEQKNGSNNGKGGGGTDNGGNNLDQMMSQLPPDSDNVTKVPNQTLAPGEQPAYLVRIPEGIRGGTQFPVTINGQQLMVTCPQMARHPMQVRIVPPPPPRQGRGLDGRQNGSSHGNGAGGGQMNGQQQPRRIPNRVLNPNIQSSDKTQMFEVVVPTGVRPGQPFALLAGGVRVLVTCPKNAVPGKTIRFHLPIALVNANKDGGPKSKLAEIKLSYDKDGWTRTIRATDMKFQWTRFDTDGNVDTRHRFDTERSAYVRKLDWEADDDRMRKGRVSLVTPDKGVVDSKIKSANGTDLVTFEDIANAQNKSYEDKIQWFQDTCAQLCVEWNEGHMRMNVRRDYLLSDSMEAVMSLSRKDLRKVWRFEFIGEAGIDAGGLAREWFELVTEEVFDPDMGLWQTSATNQMCMQINPASGEFESLLFVVISRSGYYAILLLLSSPFQLHIY